MDWFLVFPFIVFIIVILMVYISDTIDEWFRTRRSMNERNFKLIEQKYKRYKKALIQIAKHNNNDDIRHIAIKALSDDEDNLGE